MNLLIESILMGTGITIWALVILGLAGYVLLNSVDWIIDGLEAIGRIDLALRFSVWIKSLWERPSEFYLDAVEDIATTEGVKDKVVPYTNQYRSSS